MLHFQYFWFYWFCADCTQCSLLKIVSPCRWLLFETYKFQDVIKGSLNIRINYFLRTYKVL